MKIIENVKRLNTLIMKQIFWKTKNFFKKLKYRFSVENTKIENASFLFKTAISEANVKTNKMVNTKWTYQNELSFASNYFIFLKILFQLKNLLKSWFVVSKTQVPIFVLFASAGVSFDGAFSLWVSLNKRNYLQNSVVRWGYYSHVQ